MSINETIKSLIDEKRDIILQNKAPDDPNVLVYDGIVDEERFTNQNPKILLLLRDGNDPNLYEDGNGYTYRDLHGTAMATAENETPKTRLYTMWRYMCMWVRIIEDSNFKLADCCNEVDGFNVDSMRGYLSHIATVNIKKSAGQGTNDNTYVPALRRAVRNYYELIKTEISLINPNLVICGGTYDYIKGKYNVNEMELPNGRHYFVYENCVYLEYWHPGARFGYKKHFEQFKETYCQLQVALKGSPEE